MCVFNTEVTAFPRAASPPIPLWLAHMAWNLFYDPRVDVLGRCGTFFSNDFGLPRTESTSAVHSGSLDSSHSFLDTSSSLVWALGFRWNGSKPLGPSGPTVLQHLSNICYFLYVIVFYNQTKTLIGFWCWLELNSNFLLDNKNFISRTN